MISKHFNIIKLKLQCSNFSDLLVDLMNGYIVIKDKTHIVCYIKDVLPNISDEYFKQADLILCVNDCNVGNLNCSSIIEIINKKCEEENLIEFLVARGDFMRSEFLNSLTLSVYGDLATPPTNSLPFDIHTSLNKIKDRTQVSSFVNTKDADNYEMFSRNNTALTSELRPEDIFETKKKWNRKTTLDERDRVRIEKLEVALQYLGIYLDEEKLRYLRENLDINEDGTVYYGDFVKIARNIIHEDHSVDNTDFVVPINQNEMHSAQMSIAYNEKETILRDAAVSELLLENEKLRAELQDTEELLAESEANRVQTEDELRRLLFEKKPYVAENDSNFKESEIAMELRAQNDQYKDIIASLESEINDLRQANLSNSLGDVETAQRLSVLGCEVRKLEAARRTYRTMVERLMHFVRATHIALAGETRPATRAIVEESDIVLEELREALLTQEGTDELPFGWEKATALDGDSYYINAPAKPQKPFKPADAMGATFVQSMQQHKVSAQQNKSGNMADKKNISSHGKSREQQILERSSHRLPRYRLDVVDQNGVPVKLLDM